MAVEILISPNVIIYISHRNYLDSNMITTNSTVRDYGVTVDNRSKFHHHTITELTTFGSYWTIFTIQNFTYTT